jgi:hypothetical protein
MKTQAQPQPFETEGHDFSGMASLDLHDVSGFYKFLSTVADYDPEKYDPVAIKVYVAENHPIVTLFVAEKNHQVNAQSDGHIPVRKLKLSLSWSELFSFVRRFDLVVKTGKYDLKEMVVINE